MTKSHRVHVMTLAATLAVLMGGHAMADDMMPQPVHEGDVIYISGGIGESEEKALESTADHYNLVVTNADKQGHFMADTKFVIQGRQGNEIITADNAGPLFYAKLPPGEYTVKASNGDQQEVRHIRISATKPVDMHLIWRDS